MNEEVLTVGEIASAWKLSTDTIQRWFSDEPNVMVIESDTPKRNRRRTKRTLRIPVSVKERVWRKKINSATTKG